MDKIVIIVNGSGGVGKDTLCTFASEVFNTISISSIDPIKRIAREQGWKGEKDARSRKFLADLKRVFIEYNNLPYKYLVEKYIEFLKDQNQILFVQIREAKEIEKFKKYVDIPCVTLLIRRKCVNEKWGNTSDDNVEQYHYDYYYNNDKLLQNAKEDFTFFLHRIINLSSNVINSLNKDNI